MRKWILVSVLLLSLIVVSGSGSAVSIETNEQITDPERSVIAMITNGNDQLEYTMVVSSFQDEIPFYIDILRTDNGSANRLIPMGTAETYGSYEIRIFNKSVGDGNKTSFYLEYSAQQQKDDMDDLVKGIDERWGELVMLIGVIFVVIICLILSIAIAYREQLNRLKGKNTTLRQLEHMASMGMLTDMYDKNISKAEMNPLERMRWKLSQIEDDIEDIFKTKRDYERLFPIIKALRNTHKSLVKHLRGVREKYGVYEALCKKETNLVRWWKRQIDQVNREAVNIGLKEQDTDIKAVYDRIRERLKRPIESIQDIETLTQGSGD